MPNHKIVEVDADFFIRYSGRFLCSIQQLTLAQDRELCPIMTTWKLPLTSSSDAPAVSSVARVRYPKRSVYGKRGVRIIRYKSGEYDILEISAKRAHLLPCRAKERWSHALLVSDTGGDHACSGGAFLLQVLSDLLTTLRPYRYHIAHNMHEINLKRQLLV